MFEAPSPISSWFGSIRSRRLAASVCATEMDSTKPTIEMINAGRNRASMVSRLKLGSDSIGRPAGTSPTRATPLLPRSMSADHAMVRKTSSTGPARTMTFAMAAGMPKRASQFFRSSRIHSSSASATAPTATVYQLIWPILLATDMSRSGRAVPPVSMPSSPPTWLRAMMMPEAVMKPEMTGCERKLAMKPSRKIPMARRIRPDRAASRMAALA